MKQLDRSFEHWRICIWTIGISGTGRVSELYSAHTFIVWPMTDWLASWLQQNARGLVKRLWTFVVQNWKHLCSLIKSRLVTRSDNSGLRNYGYWAIDLLIISVIVIGNMVRITAKSRREREIEGVGASDREKDWKVKWPATFAKSLQSRHFQLYHRSIWVDGGDACDCYYIDG